MLGAAGDRAFNMGGLELPLQDRLNFRDIRLAFRGAFLHQGFNFGVDLRIHGFEGKILKLPFNGIHAETMREGRVNFQGFMSLGACLFLRHETPRAGIRHRDHHFAHGFRLRGFPVFDLIELRDPVHEEFHGGTEILPDLLEGVPGIFHGVMEEGSHEGVLIHTEFGEDSCHRDRMRNIRLSRAPLLAAVAFLRHVIRPDNAFLIHISQGAHKGFQGIRNLAGRASGQPR